MNVKWVVQWCAIFRAGWYLRVQAAHAHWLQGSRDTRHPAAWSVAQRCNRAPIGHGAKGGGHQFSLFIVWGPCSWKPQVYIGSEGPCMMSDFKPSQNNPLHIGLGTGRNGRSFSREAEEERTFSCEQFELSAIFDGISAYWKWFEAIDWFVCALAGVDNCLMTKPIVWAEHAPKYEELLNRGPKFHKKMDLNVEICTEH